MIFNNIILFNIYWTSNYSLKNNNSAITIHKKNTIMHNNMIT